MRYSAFVVSVLLCSTASAQERDSIDLVNTMPEPVEIWVQSRGEKVWTRYVVPRGRVARLSLAKPGDYYIVIRDQLKRDLNAGWVNLHEIVKTDPAVGLKALYQAKGYLIDYGLVNGRLQTSWRPLGSPYAWKVSIVPYGDGEIPFTREIVFVNEDRFKIVEEYPCGPPEDEY